MKSPAWRWLLALAVLAPALAALFIAMAGWNWARPMVERAVLERTGRVLALRGDIGVSWGWPLPHLLAADVQLANPPWATHGPLLVADTLDITLDLLPLWRGRVVLPEVRLAGATVWLERSRDGRSSWLMDRAQQDADAAIAVGRLSLDRAVLGYADPSNKALLQAALSTRDASVLFDASGTFRGLPFKAQGQGGPVLSLRDGATPYPLRVDASAGATRVRAEGSITRLWSPTAVDMQLALSGDSLEQLYELLGIALPPTGDYVTAGRLLHSAAQWRYERFIGRLGRSDIAGSVRVDTGAAGPVLTADVRSSVLDLADLGPIIGARPGSVAKAAAAPPERSRVLPDLPLRSERWRTLDADVTLHADHLRRADALPLDALDVRLRLRDAVVTLDPLDFQVAGGHLVGTLRLDGSQTPIRARAQLRADKLQLGRMFPTLALGRNSIGQLHGTLALEGSGNAVGAMLADASGSVALVVRGGEISRLMMEKAGLHLWEILQLNLSGDELVHLRCAVADFDVRHGVMRADALVFDTAVTTITGTGGIDLRTEALDLTLRQATKATSPLALRSPIHLGGSLARPEVAVDKAQMALRAAGAIALGVINPLLALLPLIDPGPGQDSDCAALVREARAPAHLPAGAGAARR